MPDIVQRMTYNWADPFRDGLLYVPRYDYREAPGGVGVVGLWRAQELATANPANSSALTNVFAAEGAATTGLTQADMHAQVWNASGAAGDAGVVRKLTTRTGLYVSIPAAATGVYGMRVVIKQALYDWMRASGHTFYVSVWYARKVAGESPGVAVVQIGPNSPTGYLFAAGTVPIMVVSNGGATVSGGTAVEQSKLIDNSIGPVRAAAAVRNVSANFTGTAYADAAGALFTMAPGGYNNTARNGKNGAVIWYSTYIEDLTVSGRTAAQAAAADAAGFALTPLATDTVPA